MTIRTDDPDYIPTHRYRGRLSFTCDEDHKEFFKDEYRRAKKVNRKKYKNFARFVDEVLYDALNLTQINIIQEEPDDERTDED